MAGRKTPPRGIRNNNPLNIRIGNTWLGERPDPNDPEFEQFVTMVYGIRAAFVLLRRYIRHYKRTTVPAIISAWAPSTENNTTAYIDHVCALTGISHDQQLDYFDKETMCALVAAMVQHENRESVDPSIITKAYDMA